MHAFWFLGDWHMSPASPFLWTAPFMMGGLFLIAWTLVWKGLALWHAARRNHTGWFVAMLVINTAGVLEICYLIFVAKLLGDDGESENAPKPSRPSRRRRKA